MKSYSGGIRHDYKDSKLRPSTLDRHGLSWFAIGLLLPVAALVLFLVSEPNESMVPPPGSTSEPRNVANVDPIFDGPIFADTDIADVTSVASVEAAATPDSQTADTLIEPTADVVGPPQTVSGSASPGPSDEQSATPTAGYFDASVDTQPDADLDGLIAAPARGQIEATIDALESVIGTESPRMLVMAPPPGERIALPLPPLASLARASASPASAADQERAAILAEGEVIKLKVKSGDSLDGLFRRNNLSVSDLTQMVNLPEAKEHLVRIRPGDQIQIVHEGADVLALMRPIDEIRELWIRRSESGFAAQVIDLDVETRTVGAHGTIDSSLYEAASNAGISDKVIDYLANQIFRWDIDFILDVRKGDSFSVVYEELWRDGVKLRDGDIIAAEFVNQGDVYRAARYTDASGDVNYYTPDGLNVRKAFMRNPIPIVRVSSGFNPNRRHPILNTIRAHKGVDYAAPTGTPVYAAADGKVESRGVSGGYGNAIVLQHGGNITTLYAHLSKFGKFGPGARVKQGDVIGYVGSTGQATGPHLHYEYRVAGVHRNPQTVDLPPANPIASEYREDFVLASTKLWRQLDLYHGVQLAAVAD